MRTSGRASRVLAIAVVGVLCALVVLAPSVALAAPGDSETHAVALTLGGSTAGTLTPAPASSGDCLFVYSMKLNAGQTVVATYTASTAVRNPSMLVWASFATDVAWLGSHWVSPTTRVTRVLAPKTGNYYLGAFGQSVAGMFTVDTTISPSVNYTLSTMGAPNNARAKKSFSVSTTLIGQFDELNVPVRFIVQRWSGRRWKAYGTVKPTIAPGGNASHTPLSASLRLPKGKFRVRARFTDAAHLTPAYNSWRRITVK